MHGKYKAKVLLLVSVLLVSIYFVGQGISRIRNMTEYPYLYFAHQYYFVSNAPVPSSHIGTQVTQVSRNVPIKTHNENGDANTLPLGTKVYTSTAEGEDTILIIENGEKLQAAYRVIKKEQATTST